MNEHMNKYIIIVDIQELKWKGEPLGIYTVFLPGGKTIEYSRNELDQYVYHPDALLKILQPPVERQLTLAEKIAEARAAMLGDNKVVAVHPEPPLDEEVRFVEFSKQTTTDEIIESLGLKMPTAALTSNVKVNDDAGRDGSMLDAKQAVALTELFTAGTGQTKFAVVQRIKATSLRHLMKLSGSFSKELRLAVTLSYCSGLGQGQHGEGANYIPADWAMFVEGRDTSEALAAALPFDVITKEATGDMAFDPGLYSSNVDISGKLDEIMGRRG